MLLWKQFYFFQAVTRMPHCFFLKMSLLPQGKVTLTVCLQQVTIVIKYFCQFGFFPHSKNYRLYKNAPYYPANIIGVEKKDGYVLYDLVQLLALFFHRSILKVHTVTQYNTIHDHQINTNCIFNIHRQSWRRAQNIPEVLSEMKCLTPRTCVYVH